MTVRCTRAVLVGLVAWTLLGAQTSAQTPSEIDEIGMARELGPDTWARCAAELTRPNAMVYELSHPRSGSMPLSPFAGAYEPDYLPSVGVAGTSQIFNMEVWNEHANPGQQGTQIDALGHFASLDAAWDGTSDLAAGDARYYGGLTQAEVKPTPDSPLLRLGTDKIRPIVTTALLLDARRHVGGGEALSAGEHVTPAHIDEMLEAQGLAARGILPGDVVLVYTGWSDHYRDPDTDGVYYSMAPGLSYETARYLGERRIRRRRARHPLRRCRRRGAARGHGAASPGDADGARVPRARALPDRGRDSHARRAQAARAGRRWGLHLLRDGPAGPHHRRSRRSDPSRRDRCAVTLTRTFP